MMYLFSRFPRPINDICQNNDIYIQLGIVPNHRTHTSVMSFFLHEYNVPHSINTKLYPISIHMLPVIVHMMKHLRGKESRRHLSREQGTCFHLTEEPIQITGSHMRASIR